MESDFQEEIQDCLAASLDKTKPYALFDFPNHSNVGDSMIWSGELKALRIFFGRPPILVVGTLRADQPLPTLDESTQILLHGGGNIGDLWPVFQKFRERVICHYPNNKIVQLPQSIHFAETANLTRASQVFSQHSDLILMVRDQESYKRAKGLYDGRVELAPDMALALGQIGRTSNPVLPVLALLRDDKERKFEPGSHHESGIEVVDWPPEVKGIEKKLIVHLSTIDKYWPRLGRRINWFKRYLFGRLAKKRVGVGIKTLSRGEVVVTDRLHAHVLASLMGVPHIVLDNSYGKLTSFKDTWSFCRSVVCLEAESVDDAFFKAKRVLDFS